MDADRKSQESEPSFHAVHARRRRYIPFLFALGALMLGGGFLFRPVWFDEAITIMDFVMPLDPLRIYFSYNIPNNHIIYSEFLKLWMYGIESIGMISVFAFRLPSLIIAAAAAYFLSSFMLRRCGLIPCILCSAALLASPCFMIYSTAVRGYMPGFALTVAAFITAYMMMRRESLLKYGMVYFIICILAIGITPTNIASLAAVAIFFIPDILKARSRAAKIFILAFVPMFSLLLFYLPIWEKFIACAKLGEGWHSALAAAWNLYASFAIVFLPVIPFCIFGAVWLYKKYPGVRPRLAAAAIIFLLPLPAFFLFKAPPFPRVFFPLFAVWTVLLAYSLAGYSSRFAGRKIVLSIPFILLGLWLPVCTNFPTKISDAIFGGGRTDDLTAPYYARADFVPDRLIQHLRSEIKGNTQSSVYVSFDADYPSVMFASLFSDLPEGTILADLPRKKVTGFGQLPGVKYVVCASDAEFKSIRTRFDLPSGELVFASGIQRVYRTGVK